MLPSPRADTHPEMVFRALERWTAKLAKVGLETGSVTPWLARTVKGFGLPVVVMDARRAADAVKTRPSKADRADAAAADFTMFEVRQQGSHAAYGVHYPAVRGGVADGSALQISTWMPSSTTWVGGMR